MMTAQEKNDAAACRKRRLLASTTRTECLMAEVNGHKGEDLHVAEDVAVALDIYLWGQQDRWTKAECDPHPVEFYGPYTLYGVRLITDKALPPGSVRWEKAHA